MPDLSLLDADSKAQMTPEQLQEFSDFNAPTDNAPIGPPAPASKPNEVSIDPDTFAKLSFEQLNEFKNHFPAGTSIRVGQKPKADTGNRPVDLDPDSLKQLTPDQLVEFAKQTKWSPYTWAQSHPEHLDVETKTKLAQTDVALRKQGWTWADIPVGEVVTALPSLAKGIFDYAKLAAQSTLAPEAPGRIKAQSELTAATETATMGTADLARRIYNKTGRFLHLQKPLEDYTPEDALNLFENELAIRNQMAKVVSGQGEVTQALGGEGLKQLQETGVKLDETAIQSASAGDPISFAAFGGGFKLFNAVTGKVVGFAANQSAALQAVRKLGVIRDSVARAEKLAEAIPSAENISAANREVIMQGAERGAAGPLAQGIEQAQIAGEKAVKIAQEAPGYIAGKATQGLGKALQIASEGIKRAAPYEIMGTLAHGNIPAAIGGFVAQVARPLIEKAGLNIAHLGKTVAEGAAPGGTWARAVEDLSKVPGQAIGGAAKGFPMDLGLMALSSETPEEQRESPFMATAFGAAHGLLLGGRGFAKGQILAPRPWAPSDSWSKSYGNFPELDAAHQETMKIASEGVKRRLGALRDLAATAGTELYQFSGADSLAKFLESQGRSPEDARAMAEANGMILGELKDSKGDSRKVALLRDPDSAPHEVGHALEENLSQEQQTWYYNELLKAHGEDAVMQRAKDEANALATTPETRAEATVTPDSWKNFLLRITGDGPAAAEGKIAQDPSLAGKPWDLVLTDDEKNELVKRYALKEISADTIDKALQHNGAGLAKDSTVLGVAARTIAKLLTFLGVDTYQGETAGSMETPVKPGALEAAQKVIGPALVEARGGTDKPMLELPKTGRTTGGGFAAPPGTPEEEAKRTEEIAASAPETPTGPEIDAQSQREILGVFSQAKASGSGVKITRRSAPGTPAGAMEVSRGKRRVQIEKARTIPDDQKPLWEKNFTPVKTVVLKDGSLQEQGWSPEVLAANAEKTARFVAEHSPSLSPFELDTAKKTFTPQGWKDLFDKINIYAQNQAAGLTGKGTPLEIGRAREFGFFEPTGDRIAAGTLTDAEANFINYLFGFPLPGEGKSTLARGGKAQYGVQLISEATEPGRAQPLVEPRTFESTQAKNLGFAGEQILEVNPLRTQIEQLAKAAGKPAPSPIEAWQNLNVRDIVKAEIAPELPAVRPVGVTIRAGFQPMPANPRAVRSAAVRDEHGKIFEGAWHGEAFMKAQEAPGERGNLEEGFINNEGKWYDRETATKVAEEIGQLPVQADRELESANFERSRAFQSKPLTKEQAAREDMPILDKNQFMLTVVGPDGKRYPARFDGWQENLPGRPPMAQITPKVQFPFQGEAVRSTTYDASLEQKGYKIEGLPERPAEGETVAFQAKRKERDPLKFFNAGGNGFEGSKAWILPNGKVEQLGSQWHHDWLDEHKDIQKKYGLNIPPFEGGDSEGVREQALRKGFARVNLAGATLTVEARAKDWRHIRPTIEDMIEKNIDDIDKFRVSLFDDSVGKVQKTYADKLFDADTDREKMDRVYSSFSEQPQTELERTAFQPGVKGVIGSISPYDLEIDAKSMDLSKGSHMAVKTLGHQWRYNPETQTVYWWFGIPDEKIKDAVTDWLDRKGHEVKKNVDISSSSARYDAAHGETSFQSKAPAREDFENPDTLKTALASPGWAIITATRESVGPWDAPDNVAANEKLSRELKSKGYDVLPVQGNYKGVPQGTDFLVTGIDPQDAQALGKRYGQESVLTNEGLRYSNGEITPGRPEDTLIGEEAKQQPFFSLLPNGTAFSIPLDFEAPPKAVGELPDLFGGRQVLSSRATAEMSNADLKAHFPEAIVPSKVKNKAGQLVDPKIDYSVVDSPLYKQAGSEEKAVTAFADKMVDFLKQFENHPAFELGKSWYSDFTPLLKAEFGKDAPLFAELLASSSPNETPATNFAYALDAYQGFKEGRFDKIVSKFNEGWDLMKSDKWVSWYNRELNAGKIPNPPTSPTPEAFLAHWVYKHNLKPRQSNGQLYGFHGRALLEVMARKWLTENQGLKTNQFVENLLGISHGGTIDVWAIRLMHQLGNESFKDRWRLLPKNETGVQDKDFLFSQKVFEAAGKKLGLLPDATQGAAWFALKQYWSDHGWGRLDLGSYVNEMKKIPMLKKGIKQRLAATEKRAKIKPMEAMEFALEPRPKK